MFVSGFRGRYASGEKGRKQARAGPARALQQGEVRPPPGEAMYYDEDSGALSFFAGVLLGAVLGASIALLAAPQPGAKTRKQLARAVSGVRSTAEDRWDDIADDVRSAVKAGRKRIRL
jgi:hypothetical protein